MCNFNQSAALQPALAKDSHIAPGRISGFRSVKATSARAFPRISGTRTVNHRTAARDIGSRFFRLFRSNRNKRSFVRPPRLLSLTLKPAISMKQTTTFYIQLFIRFFPFHKPVAEPGDSQFPRHARHPVRKQHP